MSLFSRARARAEGGRQKMFLLKFYIMGFSFGSIEIDNKPDVNVWDAFPVITVDDENMIISLGKQKVMAKHGVLLETYLKGYIEADKFYALHPEKYLEIKGFKGFFSCGSFCGNCGDYQVVKIGANEDFDDVCIPNINADKIERFENTPIVVFQHHVGPITLTEESGQNFIIGEEIMLHSNCLDDFLVFRGIFAAKHKEEDKYRLNKAFGRFYFK